MKYNEIIRMLREENNLTQAQLAFELNSSQRAISHWENGETAPPYDVLIAYAKFFNVSIDYILGVSNQPQKSWLDQ